MIQGSIVALVTSMFENGAVDKGSLKKLVEITLRKAPMQLLLSVHQENQQLWMKMSTLMLSSLLLTLSAGVYGYCRNGRKLNH